jgi:hypothetical protein
LPVCVSTGEEERIEKSSQKEKKASGRNKYAEIFLSQNSEMHIITKGLIFIPGKNFYS